MAELAEALAARGHVLTFFAHERDVAVVPEAKWYRVPIIPWPSLLRYVTFLLSNTLVRFIARVRDREQFDVLHSTGPDVLRPDVTTLHCCTPSVADGIAATAVVPGLRRWARVRGFVNTWSYRIIGAVERYVVRYGARKVIVVSQVQREEVQRYDGVVANRLDVVPYGVNLDEFAPVTAAMKERIRRELSVPVDTVVVVFVGYNWERKGLETLVGALELIQKEEPRLKLFLLVVGGPQKSQYTDVVTSRLQGHVRFLGARRDVANAYAASDVCVLPSEQESFGFPPLAGL